MTVHERAPLPTLTDACADQGEVLALSVMRFIAAGYMTSDAACWDAAHACAEEVLGMAEGPRLVARMATVMRALKAERARPWTFMPASCGRVTRDEAGLIGALGLARRGHGRRGHGRLLEEAARGLTGVEGAARLVRALELTAETLDALAPLLGGPGAARPGAPVH